MIILDVEASGLSPDSYPIEVAWQHRHNPRLKDSFLIKPDTNWTYWDDFAQSDIHHISRDQLNADGINVLDAASRLNASLENMVVYSDAVKYDRSWIKTLFRAAGINMDFKMMSVFGLVPPDKVGAYYRHFNKSPVSHRAADDVRQIIKSLNYVAPEG